MLNLLSDVVSLISFLLNSLPHDLYLSFVCLLSCSPYPFQRCFFLCSLSLSSLSLFLSLSFSCGPHSPYILVSSFFCWFRLLFVFQCFHHRVHSGFRGISHYCFQSRIGFLLNFRGKLEAVKPISSRSLWLVPGTWKEISKACCKTQVEIEEPWHLPGGREAGRPGWNHWKMSATL